jgi:hypothetical protein
MKNTYSIERSMIASKRKAKRLAIEIQSDLSLIDLSQFSKLMPKIRRDLAELNQRIHEFNAYRNCFETE